MLQMIDPTKRAMQQATILGASLVLRLKRLKYAAEEA
jgi:hypothetical protein